MTSSPSAPRPRCRRPARWLSRFRPTYYDALADAYRERRDLILAALAGTGLRASPPDGAYYVMVEIDGVTDEDDVTFARRIVGEPGIAVVPGSSFYSRPDLGRTKVRFAFPKQRATLEAAARRLAAISSIGPG